MKLQPDKPEVQSVTAIGDGWIALNGERLHSSVIFGSRDERLIWDCHRFDDLTAEHFATLADMRPEVFLFGSGPRIRFPQPAWIAPLARLGIGIETMDTAAACRTYNILAGEGRHVIAAVLIESPAL